MEFPASELAPKALGPYSQCVKAGGVIYCSGQLGMIDNVLQDTVEEQTKAALENMGHVLTAAGSERSKVVKCSVFVKDLNDFGAVNTVYAEFFGDHKPARACVEVARLPKDALVEITCIALA
ncbi:enamine/imine deaminase YjgF-like [Kipferlia bialata]|uniref:Enamine/imine deaminase YjgF-like n=1 Tax=Kipferlia bialata TaxID=797122 RepID=A0A9K3CVV5_9EUKA|nr:enamine/imine deaminase YjgF-like [Kipferlia bialata]|eukprot:g5732.t1